MRSVGLLRELCPGYEGESGHTSFNHSTQPMSNKDARASLVLKEGVDVAHEFGLGMRIKC